MFEPIVTISGIRGILGKSLYPENIIKYSSAFASYCRFKRIIIGYDGRLHGELIANLIESTLLMSGCEVIYLGMVPSPTVSLAVETLGAAGGISITASHNPQQWNGMKFINSKGIFLNVSENNAFLKHTKVKKFEYKPWDKIKHSEYYPDFYKFHINKVLNLPILNVNQIKKRKFKAVVDAVNSSGSLIIPSLLKRLGCTVIEIDCEGSGFFTRFPEPLPHNLHRTAKKVKQSKANIGIVVDPDADRLVIIDENGKPFGEENTIAAVIKHVLEKTPLKKRIAAVNLSTTKAVDDIVKSLKGKLFKSAVGEINVINTMLSSKAIIGGEGSGGVIFPEVHYGRDSLVGIALFLNALAESKLKVSEFKRSIPEYHIVKEKFRIEGLNPLGIFRKVKKAFKNSRTNEKDGLRVDHNNAWFNLRTSNTEPILRIITEAPTKKSALKLLIELKRIIGFN